MSHHKLFLVALAVSASAFAEQTGEPPRPAPARHLVLIPPRNGVARGERVLVEVTSGSARVAFETTAESAGGVGNFVLVRNPTSGRLFPAKVAGKGKVTIQR